MRCDAEFGLIVIINAVEHQCVNEGDILDVVQTTSQWSHRGSIVCPSCADYCKVRMQQQLHVYEFLPNLHSSCTCIMCTNLVLGVSHNLNI